MNIIINLINIKYQVVLLSYNFLAFTFTGGFVKIFSVVDDCEPDGANTKSSGIYFTIFLSTLLISLMGLPFTTSKLKWWSSLTLISNTDSKALDVWLILSFELHGLGQATFVSSSSFMEMFSGNMMLLYCTFTAKANITNSYSFCQFMCLSCLFSFS